MLEFPNKKTTRKILSGWRFKAITKYSVFIRQSLIHTLQPKSEIFHLDEQDALYRSLNTYTGNTPMHAYYIRLFRCLQIFYPMWCHAAFIPLPRRYRAPPSQAKGIDTFVIDNHRQIR